MLNKNGVYVLDCKRDRELQSITSDDTDKDEVLSVLRQYFNQNPQDSTDSNAGVTTSPPNVEPSSAVTVDSAITFDHVRGLLANLG